MTQPVNVFWQSENTTKNYNDFVIRPPPNSESHPGVFGTAKASAPQGSVSWTNHPCGLNWLFPGDRSESCLKLSLDSNQLTSLPESLSSSLPKALGHLKQLKYIECRHVTRLSLRSNKLTRLPESLLQLGNLTDLFVRAHLPICQAGCWSNQDLPDPEINRQLECFP